MAAFASDGKEVLAAGFGLDKELGDFAGELMLWDADTGKLARKLHDGRAAIRSIAVSPDRRRVLAVLSHYHSIDQPASLTIWDLASGKPAHEFSLPDMSAYWAFWSPDGREIITTGKDGVLLVVSADTGKEVRRFANQSVGYYYGAGISTDGRQLVATSKAGLAVWDCLAGRPLHKIGDENTKPRPSYSQFTFSPDGRQLLAVTESNLPGSHPKLFTWFDLESGRRLRSEEACPANKSMQSVAVSAGGRLAVSCSDEKMAVVWDFASGRRLTTLQLDGSPSSAALTPDGRLAAIGLRRSLGIWDTASGRKIRQTSLDDSCESVTFSPDGTRLAVAVSTYNKPAKLVLYDSASLSELFKIEAAHEKNVTSLSFSPDGQCLVTASRDDTAILWETATGRKLHQFRGHTGDVQLAGFLPGWRHVITVGDSTVRYWDIATGDELGRMYRSYQGDDWLLVTPDGLFDGTPAMLSRVAYRVGKGPE